MEKYIESKSCINNKMISFESLEGKYPELKAKYSNNEDNLNGNKKRKSLRHRKFRLYLIRSIKTLVFGMIAILFLTKYAIQLVDVVGESMEPTLQNGSYSILLKGVYTAQGPDRFDVIAFELDKDSDIYYIKRIIGLPGETVRIEYGNIFINGQNLLDSIKTDPGGFLSVKVEIELGEDEYFVLGDNRNNSLDSRDKNFGNVERDLILGKIYTKD